MDGLRDTATRDIMTVVKVLHFIDGVKCWYFLSNLDFDWRIVRRKPSVTWPSLIYVGNRLASIACVVSILAGLDVSSQIHCQAWISIAFLFPLVELELALLLIVFRVVAIWQCSSLMIGLTGITLSIHSGVSLFLLTGIRAFWDPGPGYKGCVAFAPRAHLLSMSTATIATYAILLIAMLVGLRQQRQTRSFGVWKVLRRQGWVWFGLAIAAEVPALTLLLLNISPSLNLLYQVPRVVIASIGTTTMFRMLYNYSGQTEAELPICVPQQPDTSASVESGTLSHPSDLKVAVHTTTDRFGDETLHREEKEI